MEVINTVKLFYIQDSQFVRKDSASLPELFDTVKSMDGINKYGIIIHVKNLIVSLGCSVESSNLLIVIKYYTFKDIHEKILVNSRIKVWDLDDDKNWLSVVFRDLNEPEDLPIHYFHDLDQVLKILNHLSQHNIFDDELIWRNYHPYIE